MARGTTWLALGLLAGLAACGGSSPPEKPAGAAAPAAELDAQAGQTPGRPFASEPQGILSVLTVEHEVDVRAQRDGVVVAIDKEEGARVRKGEVLARLDDREAAAELEKARDDLEVAIANVKYNEAEVKAKGANYRRQQELRKYGLSSVADLDKAEFEAKGAEYDLESWHAAVKRNQANIRQFQVQLERTRVRAPFDGVVARRYLRAGQTVAKDDKCFRVSQLGPLEVRFQVPETSPKLPRAGETVELRLVGADEKTYSARIARVSPTVDPASGSYDVLARIVGRNLGSLRPGMAVRVLWAVHEPAGR
jgi:membrane fusion protein, multidrug efflux system